VSSQTEFDKIDLLGVEIDALTNTEAIAYICTRATHAPAAYIVKPYVEFLDRAFRNPELQDLLNHAELALPDGVALLWAAHYLYAGRRSIQRFWHTLFQIVLAPAKLTWPLPDRTAGVNFTWPLLEQATRRGLRVYLVGDPQTSDLAHTAHTIQQQLPNLRLAGTHTGRDPHRPPGQISAEWLASLTAATRAANPDLILVGMGFPLQETVCAHLAAHLDHGLAIGEGGTFDYESFGGARPKAPAALQRIGLEWLWRLLQEPRRLRRQLAIPRFIWRTWRSR
jgi:N-acetylglucosaminyldiphosphoundecaprenol N-acetyl-beta-D-mannosaminyltransferase